MHPGWLEKLLTHPVQGLENFRELLGHLTAGNGVIKAYCEVAAVYPLPPLGCDLILATERGGER